MAGGDFPNPAKINAEQRERLQEAEKELKSELRAHEQMCELLFGEWQPVSLRSHRDDYFDELRKLDRDLRKYLQICVDVFAEAAWELNDVESFRDYLERAVREVLDRALALVNARDLGHLDQAALRTLVDENLNEWMRKARRDFPPIWLPRTASGQVALGAEDLATCPRPDYHAPASASGAAEDAVTGDDVAPSQAPQRQIPSTSVEDGCEDRKEAESTAAFDSADLSRTELNFAIGGDRGVAAVCDLNTVDGRREALSGYVKSWNCSEASLARTAVVNPADLSKWKRGSLPATSDKKARIERALRNNDPPLPPPKKRSDSSRQQDRQRWRRTSPTRQH